MEKETIHLGNMPEGELESILIGIREETEIVQE